MHGKAVRFVAGSLAIIVIWIHSACAQQPHDARPGTARLEYPQLNAPMYPVPRPDIPSHVGGVAYTNQAFAPHEMLYPHKYRALYPPYYFKVNGLWWWTPFGMESHDTWKLQGTEVKVKYHSRNTFLTGNAPLEHWSNITSATGRFLNTVLVETGEIFR